MKFTILDEGGMRPDIDIPTKYAEVIESFDAAEIAGFDFFGCSEQHYWPSFPDLPSVATIPSPEIFYAIAANRTKRIGIRTAISTLPLRHPLLYAEQLATLDIVSNGRMQFGTGRGNSWIAADAFSIPMAETQARWEEALRIIIGGWTTQGEFSYDGQFFKIPPREFIPKPIQQPHPPVMYAALSPASHEVAGRLGLGLLTGTAGVTLEKVAKRIGIYREAMRTAVPIGPTKNEYISLSVLGHCAETNEQARSESEHALINYFLAATIVYQETVSRTSPDVDFSKLRGQYNFETMGETLMIISGDPDTWVEKLKIIEELGVDEVTINFAAVDHRAVLRAIDLLGKHVLPQFQKNPVAAMADHSTT